MPDQAATIPRFQAREEPPDASSVREQVRADWTAIQERVAANEMVEIEVLQIAMKLQDAERTFREGRSDSRYDFTNDLSRARYLHEGMLKWAEVNAKYHLYSADFWRDIARRQWNTAYDFTLSGINTVLLFNGGVALACVGGLFSDHGKDYQSALSYGIIASFIGLVLCAAAMICTVEWSSNLASEISTKLINPPTSQVLKSIADYQAQHNRAKARWLSPLHYFAVGYFFVYVAIGIWLFFQVGGSPREDISFPPQDPKTTSQTEEVSQLSK